MRARSSCHSGGVSTQGPDTTQADATPPALPVDDNGPPRVLPWVLLIGGLIGLAAASVLTFEKLRMMSDPAYAPSCDFSTVVNCGSVMSSPQSAVFGFPNSFLGIGGFAIVVLVAVALLARVTFDGWFWAGLQVGVTAGAVFVHWLIAQSLYEIGALCPYCMVVWTVTMAIFWQVTLRNLEQRNAFRTSVAGALLGRHRWLPVLAWYLVVLVLVLARFAF